MLVESQTGKAYGAASTTVGFLVSSLFVHHIQKVFTPEKARQVIQEATNRRSNVMRNEPSNVWGDDDVLHLP